MTNAVTLRQVIREIEVITGRRAQVSCSEWRPGDQRYFVADTRRIAAALQLSPPLPWTDGLRRLAHWARGERLPAEPALAEAAGGA